jgi:hypothetical protein
MNLTNSVQSIQNLLVSRFNIPARFRQQLRNYYVLHWQASYLLRQLTCSRQIKREGVSYTPIFLDGLDELILETMQDEQVKCSFRRHHNDDIGYVLIQEKE